MELFCQASSSFTVALGNGCNSVTRITSRIQFLKTQDELLHKAKSLKEKLPGIHSVKIMSRINFRDQSEADEEREDRRVGGITRDVDLVSKVINYLIETPNHFWIRSH